MTTDNDNILCAAKAREELNGRYMQACAGHSEFINADSATETVAMVIKLIDREIGYLFRDSELWAVREQRLRGMKWKEITLPFGVTKARCKDAFSREYALKELKRQLENAFVSSVDEWLEISFAAKTSSAPAMK